MSHCRHPWKTRICPIIGPIICPIIGLGLAVGVLMTGCRSFTPSVSYYTLSGISVSDTKTDASDKGPTGAPLVIGISSVDIPGYVNRLQMVTRSGDNNVRISETRRWADYPDRLVKRVIGENLQALIPDSHVFNAPWPPAIRPDVMVSFSFVELVGTSDRQVILNVNWTLAPTASPDTAQAFQTLVTEPLNGSGFDALAAAHSRALEKLCREVAVAIRKQDVAD